MIFIQYYSENRSEALKADIKEELVWTPASIGNNSEEDGVYGHIFFIFTSFKL